MPSPVPPFELERLASLRRLEILDTGGEPAFDSLVRLAAERFGAPAVLINLVDRDRVWCKAHCGLGVGEIDRDLAFCAHTVMDSEVMVVTDTAADPRFADSSLVRGAPFIRFYAGAPLRTSDGSNVGTFCLLDHAPRPFGVAERRILAEYAAIAVTLMESRRQGLLAEGARLTAQAERRRLVDALELLPAAVSLFDAEDRLVLCNRLYAETFFPDKPAFVRPGRRYIDFLQHVAELGRYASVDGRPEAWIERRLEIRRRFGEPYEIRLSDGRWLRTIDRRTAEGGILSINLDITDLKRAAHARNAFIETVGHDLRTPLTSIAGVLRSASAGTAAGQDRAVAAALVDAERLIRLVDDMLDAERAEDGQRVAGVRC